MNRESSLRLFAGVYPPAGTAAALLDALEGASLSAAYRVVAGGQVHMTVHFIGETNAAELDDVLESVRGAAAGTGAFGLTPQSLETLPETGAPRLVAVTTDLPGNLLELHRRLVRRLARAPRSAAKDRFLPHLTVCRFTHDARPDRIRVPLRMAPFPVTELRVVRSVLLPTGAEHRTVESIPLG